MTKEKLEKEAEESSKKAFCIAHTHEDELIFKNGYLAGAEPREKRIEELEEENRQLGNEVEDLTAYCNQIGKIKTSVLKLFEHIVAR